MIACTQQTQHPKHILKKLLFYLQIQWGISGKAWRMVHFKEHWFHIVGENDVESEKLKAHLELLV